MTETPKAMLSSQPLISGLRGAVFLRAGGVNLALLGRALEVTVAPLIINKYLVGEALGDCGYLGSKQGGSVSSVS